MPRVTLAMVLEAPRKLVARELPIPELRDDRALLRVEVCGICGSDCEQFEGVLRTPTPVIPGHEPVGVIEAIGDAAARRWGVDAGDRVAVENLIRCRCCAACLAGRPQLCERRRLYSYLPLSLEHGLHGAYAQYLVLDEGSVVHRIDRSLPPAIAALFNPLGAGYRWAVEIPKTQPGASIAILGPGQRGLACVLAAREAGAAKILVTGLAADAAKLALARDFGADLAIDVENQDAREEIRAATGGRGVDIVVDVSPYATAPVRDALDYCAPGGTVVLAGIKGFRPIDDFVSDKIVLKEIRLCGAFGVSSSAYRSAIRLIESRRVPLERMHTHDFPLREAERAIRTLAREIPGEDAIHCALFP